MTGTRTRFISILGAAALSAILCLGSCSKAGDSSAPVQVVNLSRQVSCSAGSAFIGVTCAGSWTLEIEADGDWARLLTDEGNGNLSNIVLQFDENGAEGPRQAIVRANSGTYSAETVLTQYGTAGMPKEENGTPQSHIMKPSSGWMELPEVKSGDGNFYYHEMIRSGHKERNYSFYWNEEDKLAEWVAYPLNEGLRGSGWRTDCWDLDPLLWEQSQPAVYGYSYRRGNGGDYVRGHQLPSNDRLDYAANLQTFYCTNQTPQNQSFNAGVWESLEESTRDWAKRCDTLYVVTGYVMDNYDIYALDNVGKHIPVPTGYYKALLRYIAPESSYSGAEGYSAIAVYMEHKAGAARQYMSVKKLEERLGINFFVNLPSAVGQEEADKIENTEPAGAAWWGIR